jgi:hypothetical protein
MAVEGKGNVHRREQLESPFSSKDYVIQLTFQRFVYIISGFSVFNILVNSPCTAATM